MYIPMLTVRHDHPMPAQTGSRVLVVWYQPQLTSFYWFLTRLSQSGLDRLTKKKGNPWESYSIHLSIMIICIHKWPYAGLLPDFQTHPDILLLLQYPIEYSSVEIAVLFLDLTGICSSILHPYWSRSIDISVGCIPGLM